MTPLHQLGDLIRQTLQHVPLGWARVLFVGTLLLLLLWVVTLSPAETRPNRLGDRGYAQDLRLWAALALLIQVVIYLIL